MTHSLRARLLFAHGIVVVGAILSLALLEVGTQRRWVVQRSTNELRRVALTLATTLAPAESRDLGRVATAIDSAIALRITFVSRDGRVLADSRAQASTMENHRGREEINAALQGRPGAALRKSHTTGVEMLYCAVPLSGFTDAAVLRVAEPLDLVRRLDGALLRLSFSILALVLVASLVAVWWVAGRFTLRVKDLELVARAVGRGGKVVRAAESPADALGRLGRALNLMSSELRLRMNAVQRERDDREQILAHMTDGVALVDGAGRIAHVNHPFAAMLEAPRPAAPGTPFADFVRIAELDELLRAARREGHTVERELRLWMPRPRVVRASATPLGGPTPQPVLLVLHDLTEAEAVSRMRQEFVANVSHELRTPLTSLSGYAETLLEGGLEDAEHRESFVRIIRDQAVRLHLLVADLLSLAEVERPDAQLRVERLDLRALALRHAAVLRDTASRQGVTLGVAEGPPVWVEGDRVRLEQVVANLLDNAVKYTEQGSVEVRVGQGGDRAWCEVRDTGPGIPAEDIPRIFERFYRVDKARSREKGGTGLGLSIVKHVVALHGGEVSVSSRLGEGSVFRFEVPLLAVAAR
ncbi:MAG: ATP-binding protein [Candidatus Eisenbacteria bacterium]